MICSENLPIHDPALTYPGRMSRMLSQHLDTQMNYSSGRALDWGCSYGISTRELSELFHGNINFVGIDIDETRLIGIEQATDAMKALLKTGEPTTYETPVPDFVAADGYLPPFANKSFELIFMLNNLTELLKKSRITQKQLQTILERNLAILKVDGTLVIGTNAGLYTLLVFIKKTSDHTYTTYVHSENNSASELDTLTLIEQKVVATEIERAVAAISKN